MPSTPLAISGTTAEEGASIRAVQRVYALETGNAYNAALDPKDIAEIADGRRPGDRAAARKAWCELGKAVGDAAATALSLVDGLVVIGGGLSGSSALFLPAVVEAMNATLLHRGHPVSRMELKAYNLEDPAGLADFVSGHGRMVKVPRSDRTVPYDPDKRTGVGITQLGIHAVALGAYAFALNALDGAA